MIAKLVPLLLLPVAAHAIDCGSTTTYRQVEAPAAMSVAPSKVVKKKAPHPVHSTSSHAAIKVVSKPKHTVWRAITKPVDCPKYSTPPHLGDIIIGGGTIYRGAPLIWGVPPYSKISGPMPIYPGTPDDFGTPRYGMPAGFPATPTTPGRGPTASEPTPTGTIPAMPTTEPTVPVPEPGPLPVLLLGLVMIFLSRKIRF